MESVLYLIWKFAVVCVLQYNKHLFVHIGSNVSYADPQLEVAVLF